jgi:1,4-alpha-glucan branching enzyme
LQHPIHKGLQETVKTLNHFYTHETSLFEKQFDKKGFEWLEADDEDNSIYIYLRKGKNVSDTTLIMLNLTPEIKECKVGCKRSQTWEVLFNSDDKQFGGSGVVFEILKTENAKWKDFSTTMTVKLPPLSGVILKSHKK